jgi:hypothetical protein
MASSSYHVLAGMLPLLRLRSPVFTGHTALPAAIKRVFYLSNEGTHREHEVCLSANSQVLSHLHEANAIIYGVGSLYTSIAPSLVLKGVGEAVAARDVPKILLLNGSHDRETSRCLRHEGPMTAVRPCLPRIISSAYYRYKKSRLASGVLEMGWGVLVALW